MNRRRGPRGEAGKRVAATMLRLMLAPYTEAERAARESAPAPQPAPAPTLPPPPPPPAAPPPRPPLPGYPVQRMDLGTTHEGAYGRKTY